MILDSDQKLFLGGLENLLTYIYHPTIRFHQTTQHCAHCGDKKFDISHQNYRSHTV